MEDTKTAFRIGELSTLTNVKTGTIRFYGKSGFLSPAKRLLNGYRMFEKNISTRFAYAVLFLGAL